MLRTKLAAKIGVRRHALAIVQTQRIKMLTQLQLKNFKGWKDTKPITMAPLTVFFGTNSSGKSSIEQFLLMLKQTVDSSDRKTVIFPGDANSPVNLGSFEELVHGRDSKQELGFSFEWGLSEPLDVKDPRTTFKCSGQQMHFSAKLGMAGERHPALAVKRFEYILKDHGKQTMRVTIERKPVAKIEYKLDAEPYVLARNLGRKWPLGTPIKFYPQLAR